MYVIGVRKALLGKASWKYISAFTLVINHMCVICVVKSLRRKAIGKHTNILTLKINLCM